jgi:hypothetical protein
MREFGIFILALTMTITLLATIGPGASSPRKDVPEATERTPAGVGK